MKFITETYLREHFGLGHGTEITLPAQSKLTPSALQLLHERSIRVKFVDPQGRVFLPDLQQGASARQPVHPLTGSKESPGKQCSLCHQDISDKPDTLTHLDEKTLVPKNHPRLCLRGKMDSVIAYTVLIQTTFDPERKFPKLTRYLADIRSYLGHILRAEVTGEPVERLAMGEMDEEKIHHISHHPLQYFGHEHIVPAVEHGPRVAKLNYLRTMVREAELLAAGIYIDESFQVSRSDIIQGLNRVSSAVYVLMLMTLVSEQKKVTT